MALGDIFNLPTYASSAPLDSNQAIYQAGEWYAKHQIEQIEQAQLAQRAAQNISYEPSPHAKALQMLKMRLAGLDSKFHISKDEFLTCHVADGIVYIFFVINGKAGNTQEESALFPSDKLITQFRLIR